VGLLRRENRREGLGIWRKRLRLKIGPVRVGRAGGGKMVLTRLPPRVS